MVLAGAFGSHIDPKYAMVLGMIPDCALENVVSVGNAADTRARIALLNGQARKEIEWVERTIEKVETAAKARWRCASKASSRFSAVASARETSSRAGLPGEQSCIMNQPQDRTCRGAYYPGTVGVPKGYRVAPL